MREGPVEGVAPGRPAGLEERVPVVLVESLLHLPQQLVVGHAAQLVRESRRVAKVRHRRVGLDQDDATRCTFRQFHNNTRVVRLHEIIISLAFFSEFFFRVAKLTPSINYIPTQRFARY